jgi:hypothetical protein
MNLKLVGWINEKVDTWRDHRDDNYQAKWDEYERIWRGVWSTQDKQRESERSRIISPATQQAIESHTSEIEEALWGTGANLFDIEDDFQDQDKTDIEYVKKYMHQCFKKNKIRKSISDIVLIGSIYGTGIGEVVLEEKQELVPATQDLPDADITAIGTQSKTYVSVTLKAINPRNFLIDPSATTIEEALGVGIEEYVSAHVVAKGMEEGFYNKVDLTTADQDEDFEASSIDQPFQNDKVLLLKYYGLVPAHLLEEREESPLEEEMEDASELLDNYGNLVEALVVIANGGILLKAEATPYMMKDRPVVAYQDDSSPNRFWGRGIAEKGYNMQKAIDAQLRSHMDSLALTTAPMMAMDATRLPRGSKYEIKAGKSILTNGNPSEILMPFKFGVTDVMSIETAGRFEQMLLQATGTLDTASMASQPDGGELSVALSGIIKKNKRTLVNFQEQFLIPFIEKTAWRFMQFDPENFPVKDFKFVPSGTLGMLAREVEQLQFINLLKTIGTDNAIMPILLQGVVQNSALPNKEEMLLMLAQAQQPDPKQEQIQQMQLELEIKSAQLELAGKEADVYKTQAETQQIALETQLYPDEIKAKLVAAISNNLKEGNGDDVEFQRRAKVAELMLKERDINLKERDLMQNAEIVKLQMQNKGGQE